MRFSVGRRFATDERQGRVRSRRHDSVLATRRRRCGGRRDGGDSYSSIAGSGGEADVILTPVKIIISASAGSGNNGIGERLVQLFEEHQLEPDISLAESGGELTELAREAVRGTYQTIVAAGGDGTINAVATEVVDSDKTFGVLPLGTLNHFARDLKIPFELDAAVRTLVAGHTTDVDVA